MSEQPPMTPLDCKVSTKELNMLKVMLPYVDFHFQPMLATYIKYTELRATIDLFAGGADVFGTGHKSPDFSDIISAILPYLAPEERESMENMQNIINTMNMFEQYKDMFTPEMMGAFNGMEDTSSDNILSMFEQLSGLM